MEKRARKGSQRRRKRERGFEIDGELPEKVASYEGVYYKLLQHRAFIEYPVTVMDAQVAYGFHHLRNEKPYLASGPISNNVWVAPSSMSFAKGISSSDAATFGLGAMQVKIYTRSRIIDIAFIRAPKHGQVLSGVKSGNLNRCENCRVLIALGGVSHKPRGDHGQPLAFRAPPHAVAPSTQCGFGVAGEY
ncbi:hypothetical protein JHK85_006728 [Glycine max]|nr:hypothetical protein JHK85_006728 [Glycine max]